MDQAQDPREAYRVAQADAKAAKARARALRPWYKKKRFILGIPLLAFVALMVIAVATAPPPDGSATSSGNAAAGSSGSTAAQGSDEHRIGDVVQVGSLDLTVIDVNRSFDSAQYNMFNETNTAIRVRATNARGDEDEEYNIGIFSFQAVDDTGVAHDTVLSCAGCPDEISSVDLVRGGSVTGNLYFEIPSDRQLTELIYEPLLSTNKVRITLR